MESQRQQQQRHENRNIFKQKTCLQLQISVCHVIKVNRYVRTVLRPLK